MKKFWSLLGNFWEPPRWLIGVYKNFWKSLWKFYGFSLKAFQNLWWLFEICLDTYRFLFIHFGYFPGKFSDNLWMLSESLSKLLGAPWELLGEYGNFSNTLWKFHGFSLKTLQSPSGDFSDFLYRPFGISLITSWNLSECFSESLGRLFRVFLKIFWNLWTFWSISEYFSEPIQRLSIIQDQIINTLPLPS